MLTLLLAWFTLCAICVFCYIAGCVRGEAVASRHRCPEPVAHELDRMLAEQRGGGK